MQDEFSLIREHFAEPFAALCAARPEILAGSGDDAALIASVPGQDWVISVDTFVEQMHFPPTTPAADIAAFALAAALSDLAACGADPVWFTLSLSMPQADRHWLQAFSEGLRIRAAQYHCALIGGDTVRGPLLLSLQVAGLVPSGRALVRAGAVDGDDLYVSGVLGGCALQLRTTGTLQIPSPRIALGLGLRGLAHAAIDISDGLCADAAHLARASGLAAELDWVLIPCAEGCARER